MSVFMESSIIPQVIALVVMLVILLSGLGILVYTTSRSVSSAFRTAVRIWAAIGGAGAFLFVFVGRILYGHIAIGGSFQDDVVSAVSSALFGTAMGALLG